MKNILKSKITIICLMLLLPALIAIPAYSKNITPQEEIEVPPPEALEACEGKKAGDNVPFIGRQGEALQATCKEIEGKLVAVPAAGPDAKPPQQR